MRKKLPFCVGLLLRLLKKNHRVYVTCTTGFDRSPASVIAYLHWMTDTSLHAAYNFVIGLHSCKPDRFLLLILFLTVSVRLTCSQSWIVCFLNFFCLAVVHECHDLRISLLDCCRPAIAWATWDLIAMVENGRHDGPATHAVTFVWNGQEVIDNFLVSVSLCFLLKT